MSSCDTCDCPDKSNCPKKGNSYGIEIIETRKSYNDHAVTEVPAAEHDGMCQCGSSCACVDCTCGN